MEPETRELWCCFEPGGWPLYQDTLQRTRKESQEALRKLMPDNNPWGDLYRMGFRCIRVNLTPSHSAR